MHTTKLPEKSSDDGMVKFTDDSLKMPAPVSVADDTNQMQHDSSMPAIGKMDQFGIHFSEWFGFIRLTQPLRKLARIFHFESLPSPTAQHGGYLVGRRHLPGGLGERMTKANSQ